MADDDVVGIGAGNRSLCWAGELPDAAELLLAQRHRLAERLAGLDAATWRQPTRCHLWDVADVVAHLTDTNRWLLAALAAAADPSAPPVFEKFDNRVTPHQQVVAARGRTPGDLLDDLVSGTEAATKDLVATAGDPALPWVGFPAGRGRPMVVGLHLLWDSWLHERDVLVPLALGGDHPEDELAAVAAYAVFFSTVPMGPFDPAVSIDVVLRDRIDRCFRLQLAADVRFEPHARLRTADAGGAGHRVEGSTVATVDALAGRGALSEVVRADPDIGERLQAVPERMQPT